MLTLNYLLSGHQLTDNVLDAKNEEIKKLICPGEGIHITQFLVVNALSRYLSKTRVTQRKGAIDSTLVEELEKADQGKDF